ncbi:MAG: hypothetical protein ACM3SW_16335 [Actinomycetota bacterium]
MTYRKPEIKNLGNAASAIQLVGKVGSEHDPGDGMRDLNPAYDLDE